MPSTLRRVGVGVPCVQQGADQRGVPLLGRGGKRGLAGRPRGSGQSQRQHRRSGDSFWLHRILSWPGDRRIGADRRRPSRGGRRFREGAGP